VFVTDPEMNKHEHTPVFGLMCCVGQQGAVQDWSDPSVFLRMRPLAAGCRARAQTWLKQARGHENSQCINLCGYNTINNSNKSYINNIVRLGVFS